MKSVGAFILLLVGGTFCDGAAFVPAVSRHGPQTVLAFGFLKELGLEKPSWLPDFGGKKDKEASEEVVAEASKEEETEEAPAE